jgi:hypothetical protein
MRLFDEFGPARATGWLWCCPWKKSGAFEQNRKLWLMKSSWTVGGVSLLFALWALGCASPQERKAFTDLKAAETERVEVAPHTYTRQVLPALAENSTLDDYLAYAALNNAGLEAAFYRWKAELERVQQVRTLPDPRFNYGYFIQSVETRVGPQEDRLGISQMFPWFGKLRLRGEAALEMADAAQQQYEHAKLMLFNRVKDAYYELYYLGRAIAVTTENRDLVQQFETVANAKYEADTAMYADVIKAQDVLLGLGADPEPCLGHGLQRRRHSAGRWSALRAGRAAHSRPGRGADGREHGDCGDQRATAETENITRC